MEATLSARSVKIIIGVDDFISHCLHECNPNRRPGA
jgi:hypothetical protein